jgi:hypothetical protein
VNNVDPGAGDRVFCGQSYQAFRNTPIIKQLWRKDIAVRISLDVKNFWGE